MMASHVEVKMEEGEQQWFAGESDLDRMAQHVQKLFMFKFLWPDWFYRRSALGDHGVLIELTNSSGAQVLLKESHEGGTDLMANLGISREREEDYA